MTVKQLFLGVLCGALISLLVRVFLRYYKFPVAGFDMAFFIGIALLSYALPAAIGGNGYLSAYIVGIVLGNCRIRNKKSLVHFFDGISWIMQMVLFFVLGLLAYPSHIPAIIGPAVLIALFMMFVARPAAVFGILSFFKIPFKEKLFVSWVGLRGAAAVSYTHLDVYKRQPLA